MIVDCGQIVWQYILTHLGVASFQVLNFAACCHMKKVCHAPVQPRGKDGIAPNNHLILAVFTVFNPKSVVVLIQSLKSKQNSAPDFL